MFILLHGELDVLVDGTTVKTLIDGDSFGELNGKLANTNYSFSSH